MKKLNQILREGVYDPGIFKAFFLAGGPGSGKTFVTRSAFGGTGLKLVNSDAAFERAMKKAGLSLKMPDAEEYFRNIVRAKAKMTTATQLDTYMQGRLGLVIDATGRDINVINTQKRMLDQIGYDSYMIFMVFSCPGGSLGRPKSEKKRLKGEMEKKNNKHRFFMFVSPL